MRRIGLTIASVVLVAAAVGASGAAGGDGDLDGPYLVRAYFDNGGFIVNGEEVRVAGANVGTIAEVDVSRPGEQVSLEPGGDQLAGKAVAVLDITEPAFKDFREDATCIIRPQSLLGEKFIDCLTTQPRAAGSEAPPELGVIPDGEIGEGQRLLPLESNGKAVDLDIVQNIMRQPRADRFRIILNDLGAGLAANGDELAEVIERANPALRETDEVLAILARQNRELAQLAKDSDTALAPLARERDRLSSFITNAGETAAATAERRSELTAGFERLPTFLNELRRTSSQLRNFAVQGTPVAAEFNRASKPLADATRELGPFTEAATGALVSLGDAGDDSKADLIASEPVLRRLGKLGSKSKGGAKALNKLLRSLRRTGGVNNLMATVYNTSGSVNGYDSFGHYLRGFGLVTNCADYAAQALSGCISDWEAVPNEVAGARQPTAIGEPLYAPKPTGGRGARGEAAESGALDPTSKATRGLLDYLTGNDR